MGNMQRWVVGRRVEEAAALDERHRRRKVEHCVSRDRVLPVLITSLALAHKLLSKHTPLEARHWR